MCISSCGQSASYILNYLQLYVDKNKFARNLSIIQSLLTHTFITQNKITSKTLGKRMWFLFLILPIACSVCYFFHDLQKKRRQLLSFVLLLLFFPLKHSLNISSSLLAIRKTAFYEPLNALKISTWVIFAFLLYQKQIRQFKSSCLHISALKCQGNVLFLLDIDLLMILRYYIYTCTF